MAFTKTTGSNGSVRYQEVGKDGSNFVKTDTVPKPVVEALKNQKDGHVVDELGEHVDPKTDTDDSADEAAPKSPDTPDEDDDEDENDEQTKKDQAELDESGALTPEEIAAMSNGPVPQSEPGMGFPRVNGKTVDIFDGKTPHTHVKSVAGIMVPLSSDSYANKTDVDIYRKLKEMKKVA